MLLCGLEEESVDRVRELLTDTLGQPEPGDAEALSAALNVVTGSPAQTQEAQMWRCADATVYLTQYNGVVLVLLTDPTL